MWKRIEYADWVAIIPILSFILTFSVFLLLVTRALLMKKPHLNKLASLPLADSSPTGKGAQASRLCLDPSDSQKITTTNFPPP